jgi:hypothetical protein
MFWKSVHISLNRSEPKFSKYIRQCSGKFELTKRRFSGTKEKLIREKKDQKPLETVPLR